MSDELREQIGREIAEAIHNATCNCLDRGFGYTLRTRDLDAIGEAAMSVVAPLLAEKDAEIERLTRQAAEFNAYVAKDSERLNNIVDKAVAERDAARAELAERDAEIERLHGIVLVWRDAANRQASERDAARAEVERLKLEIQGYQVDGVYEKGWERGSNATIQAAEKARAETAELRAERNKAVATLEQFRGYAELECERLKRLAERAVAERDTAVAQRNGAADDFAEARAELEALRGRDGDGAVPTLLAAGWTPPAAGDDTTRVADWFQQVFHNPDSDGYYGGDSGRVHAERDARNLLAYLRGA